jgi:hypothetical protein
VAPILALLRSPAALSAIDSGVPEADFGAGVRLADIDGDGRVDLLVATWSPLSAVSSATAEPVTAGPVYAVCDVLDAGQTQRVGGATGPVFFTQGMTLGDLDNASSETSSFTPCDGGASTGFVISIPDPHLPLVSGVAVNGQQLDKAQYLAVPGSRLVYIAGGFRCTNPPTVSYAYSPSLDLAVADLTTGVVSIFLHK